MTPCSGAGRMLGAMAVLIPTFRRPQILQAVLASLSEGIRVPDQEIVSDNDPKSSTCPEPIPGLPRHTIHSGLDLNPAGARNVGWRSATSDLCVFIDDDDVVEAEAVAQLALVFEDLGVGFGSLASHRPIPSAQHIDVAYRGHARCLCSRTVLETLGGLDAERFPMYYEEAHLGACIRALGLRAVVTRNARIHPYGWTEVGLGWAIVRTTMPDGAERARRMARQRTRSCVLHHRAFRGRAN